MHQGETRTIAIGTEEFEVTISGVSVTFEHKPTGLIEESSVWNTVNANWFYALGLLLDHINIYRYISNKEQLNVQLQDRKS